MQAPTAPNGYVAPSGVVTNGSAVVPVVPPTPTNAPAVVAPVLPPPPSTVAQTEQSVREGNDLVIYYPNGAVDRFRDYFNPRERPEPSMMLQPPSCSRNPNPGGFVKPLVSSVRTGNDRYVTFSDGTQKILTNFFLPHIPNSQAENDGAYIFGTGVTDPEYMKLYGGNFPTKSFWCRTGRMASIAWRFIPTAARTAWPGGTLTRRTHGFLVTQAPDAPDPVFF